MSMLATAPAFAKQKSAAPISECDAAYVLVVISTRAIEICHYDMAATNIILNNPKMVAATYMQFGCPGT
jgi:hypothetical protein